MNQFDKLFAFDKSMSSDLRSRQDVSAMLNLKGMDANANLSVLGLEKVRFNFIISKFGQEFLFRFSIMVSNVNYRFSAPPIASRT